MSKYTTEVRFICEHLAGLDESVGYEDVDEVIEKSYEKIFKVNKIPMYNGESAEHRAELYKKILGHYYTREIGYETVGLWKQKLNQKLIEIMPYYNKMYESTELEFEPLVDVNYIRGHQGEHSGSRVMNGSSDSTRNVTLRHERLYTQGNDTTNNSVVSQGDSWNLFSDTPEGGIDGIENASSGSSVGNNSYLTTATHVLNKPEEQSVTSTHGDIREKFNPNGDNSDTTIDHSSANSTEGNSGNDAYVDSVKGKMGGKSYAQLLQEYRESILNVDLLVIEALNDLFLQLW